MQNDSRKNNELVIYCAREALMVEAERIAESTGARVTPHADDVADDTLHLKLDESGLALACGGLELVADFTSMLPRLKEKNMQHEILVKAAKVKGKEHPVAVDATAGLGEDALILASAGFSVNMYEKNPIIAALLEDAMRRARQTPELADAILRMRLYKEDSIEALPRLDYEPDVVLLDPMFPERQKSALVKKKFQLLHMLEMPCASERELLDAAKAARPAKIVIKRPLKAPYLAGVRPGYSLTGKAIRYDCFALSRV